MDKLNLSTLLGFLPIVGPVIAAKDEFRKLWDEATATFSNKTDQDTLKAAYAAAISDADDAHARLQAIVAQHS